MDTQKKILITYFENFGICPKNKLCINIINTIQKELGAENCLIEYCALRTTFLFPTQITKKSKVSLDKETKKQYKYIISIGSYGLQDKSIIERIEPLDNLYIFPETKTTKNLFKFDYKPSGTSSGACYRIRDYIIEKSRNNPNIKVDFLHIIEKYRNTPNEMTKFLVKEIRFLINHS